MNHYRNYKTSPIIQKESLILPADTLSRRRFLYWGGATALTWAISPLDLFNQQAMANPVLSGLAWTGRTMFAELISWFVGRVLDRRFPDFGKDPKAGEKLANELNVKKITPTPTEDNFHNRYASPYAVMNPDYHFDSTYSNEFKYYVELNSYLRSDDDKLIADFKNLSTPEIQRIADEKLPSRTILFPCGRRCPRFPMIIGLT